jgi:tetratricopeptide (TPR) repeat protein
LSQTVWPTDLAVLYPYPASFPTAWVVGSLVLLALICLAVVGLARRSPYLVVGWFWFLITLAPVCGLIQVGGHARADRYAYVPLIGVFLMLAWGLAELLASRRGARAILSTASIAVLLGLLVVARTQTAHWRDSVALWTHSLACTPDNPEARHNLGDALAARNNWLDAVQQYQRALELMPDHVLAHDALGVALATQGQLDEAIPHFERALQLRPNFAVGHYNLAVAFASKGRLVEAMRQCEEAIRLKPDYAEAHLNLALGLATQGKLEEARSHFEQALNLALAQGKLALAETVRQRLVAYPAVPPQSLMP